jgi:hypothetical protein
MSYQQIRQALRLRACAHRARALVRKDCDQLADFLRRGFKASELTHTIEQIAEVHVDAVLLAERGGELVVTH